MRGVPLLLPTTCNSVSVGLLSESVGHADMLVTFTAHRKLPPRRTLVICFHSRISICSVHYGNIILNTRQIYLFNNIRCSLNMNCNPSVFIMAAKSRTRNRKSHQLHIKAAAILKNDNLNCTPSFHLSLFP